MCRMRSCVGRGRLLVTLPLVAMAMSAPAAGKGLPKFSDVEARAKAFFIAESIAPDDLIDRSQATAALAAVAKLGWKPKDPQPLLEQVHSADSYFIRRLRKPDGQRFLAQINRMPLGLDRLDRLAALDRGPAMLDEFVRGPDGHKMIEYMTSTRGGRNLGAMLAGAPNGQSFNEPTGRIYTAGDFLTELKKLYAAEREAALKASR